MRSLLLLRFPVARDLLATRPPGLLVVYGQVVERDLWRAGVSSGGAPSQTRAGRRVPFGVTVVITADGQVVRQRDLHLKPHLSVLGEDRAKTRYEARLPPLAGCHLFILTAACIPNFWGTTNLNTSTGKWTRKK